MSELKLVIGRFSAHEFTVRKLYGTDPEFREACEDYACIGRALERWKDHPVKTRHYRTLIRELEEEILERLDRPTNPSR